MSTFSFSGIDHIQLAAPQGCETDARRFFGELLGWKEIAKPEPLRQRGGVWFQCGVHEVHIGVQQNFIPAAKAHPAFAVRSLQALRQHLQQNEIAIVDDDARSEQGISRFYVNDPFGNRLEFLEQVSPLDQ
ncbi:glyoxalase [Paenibacillus montaniterrae]|uniref:Glyoxalase n=1 Tax=Paenibacillus montaniterrae TaxID=429341 RepID=A0A920CUK3_9BACL|nr:glyoxalase [Paenibacillus montaniterrae]GIP17122.1 glyoxalase [Paenibacillus montaniterrae]